MSCRPAAGARLFSGIYKHLLSNRSFGLTHSLLATRVMPTLVPLCVAPSLSLAQFDDVIALLRGMLDKIEVERSRKMMSEQPNVTGDPHARCG